MTPTLELAVPERTAEQRFAALRRANETRTFRADVKRDLKRKPRDVASVEIARILQDPPERMHTMKVFDLLLSCPKLGKVKVNRMLYRNQISPSKTLAGLSDRQRRTLIGALRSA